MSRPLALLAFALALALPARAQTFAPGLSVESLDALFSRPAKVEVNLSGALLRLAGSVAADEEPAASALLSGLRAVTVRVYALDAARADLTDQIAGYGRSLTSAGWQTMVRVRPDGEDADDVSVFVREAADGFDGMLVMALDAGDGDAAFVFIDGPVDLARLTALSDRFAGTDLDEDDDSGTSDDTEAPGDSTDEVAP